MAEMVATMKIQSRNLRGKKEESTITKNCFCIWDSRSLERQAEVGDEVSLAGDLSMTRAQCCHSVFTRSMEEVEGAGGLLSKEQERE